MPLVGLHDALRRTKLHLCRIHALAHARSAALACITLRRSRFKSTLWASWRDAKPSTNARAVVDVPAWQHRRIVLSGRVLNCRLEADCASDLFFVHVIARRRDGLLVLVVVC